jgi:beta-fructofuranosidase
MLASDDDWIWDCWPVDDGETFHLFFLSAPKSLTPAERHFHARVGHAVSPDLHTWTRVEDAVLPGSGGYDTRAVWTGCVIADGDGWRMFRTGLMQGDTGIVQRIGCDLSDDLHTWRPDPSSGWPLRADPRWYEQSATDEHWRDPWVVADDAGRFHMYITARVRGAGAGRGVIGHATSSDLIDWVVQPPLADPGGFEQVEVIQTALIEGRWALIFSCLGPELAPSAPGKGGIWSVEIDGPGARVDLGRATRLTDESLYAGRLVRDRAGAWQLLAFVNEDEHHEFGGWICDPVPVQWGVDSLVVSPQPFTTDRPARTCR